MEDTRQTSNTMYMNIENFSHVIGEKLDVDVNIVSNYIFANISMGLARNNEFYNEIDRLYLLDKFTYYKASVNSKCIEHVMMMKGSLKQELYARKVLGILLAAEENYILRNKVIKFLRRCYPIVYKSVKKLNKNELKIRYMKMDEFTRNIEARLDAAVYFYFAIYCSSEIVDQGYIVSIIEDIRNFEEYSPMKTDIDKEINKYRRQIDNIKTLVYEKIGNIYGYKDIINSDKSEIEELGEILENIFVINKLDINYVFRNYEKLDIDKIILAYVKMGDNKHQFELILHTIVNGVFIQSIINEYKESRKLYFESNEEIVNFKLNGLEEQFDCLKDENEKMKLQVESLEKEKALFNEKINGEINKLNKSNKTELNQLKSKIKELENQLLEEKKYRSELNLLREYIFELKNEYIPHDVEKTLDNYIGDKKVLIIGGAKNWRRKFREKYPLISTLNGFNDNFDINILNNVDYIFFYTGYMNHSTYNRVMGYIRTHQIKFGYIGKTNMELVEEELIEELKQCSIGRRLNLSD